MSYTLTKDDVEDLFDIYLEGKMNKDNPVKNEEGYMDLTRYDAVENIDREQKEREREKHEAARVTKLVHTVFYICNIAGFDVAERIVLRDKKTGRIWR